MQIILASTSEYRRSLLKKLIPEFTSVPPHVDETPLLSEPPQQLAGRLAEAKAQAVALQFAQTKSLVIGSDQVATVDEQILGKPGSMEKAIEQLTLCNGKTVRFYTGLSLVNCENQSTVTTIDTFDVRFKQLTDRQIKAYVEKEKPLNCAGSFKSEGFGISLFESLQGKDPNTLIGLPLIDLTNLLLDQGYDVLGR